MRFPCNNTCNSIGMIVCNLYSVDSFLFCQLFFFFLNKEIQRQPNLCSAQFICRSYHSRSSKFQGVHQCCDFNLLYIYDCKVNKLSIVRFKCMRCRLYVLQPHLTSHRINNVRSNEGKRKALISGI